MATTSLLPLDIIEIILSKLPVKPLLRFKSVCRSWNALISDPVFIQNHHHKSISSNPHNLFLCNLSSPNILSFVKLEDGKLQTLEEKLKGLPPGLNHVLGFGDGVLLLTDTFFSRYVLFNPSTRTHTKLGNKIDIHQFTYGLCRDPTTDDFKVVVIFTRDCYAVYSCTNKSWTNRKPPTITVRLNGKPGVSVNGAIYWVRMPDGNRRTTVIVYFDPRDDTLKILPKPKDIDEGKMIYLVDWRSSLCLYCRGEDTVRIWTKEMGIDNNSWKELMTIHNMDMPLWLFQPQCSVGDKVLILNKADDELVVYSPSEMTFDFERFEGIKLYGLGLIPYMDTLFSPITNTRPKRKRKLLY